jgi:nicotinate phosphoribosyltransferase
MSRESDNEQGEALLKPMMKAGRRLESAPTLAEIRKRAAQNLERLPEPLRRLDPGVSYPVGIAEPLHRLARETDRRLAPSEHAAS